MSESNRDRVESKAEEEGGLNLYTYIQPYIYTPIYVYISMSESAVTDRV